MINVAPATLWTVWLMSASTERLDLKVIAGQIGGNHGHLAMARRDDGQPPGYLGELGRAALERTLGLDRAPGGRIRPQGLVAGREVLEEQASPECVSGIFHQLRHRSARRLG